MTEKTGDTIPATTWQKRSSTAAGHLLWSEEWTAQGGDGGYEISHTADRSGYAVSFFQRREVKGVVGLGRVDTLDEAVQVCEAHNKQRTT